MLLRTKCSRKVAVLIRVILFFGVPSLYLLFHGAKTSAVVDEEVTEVRFPSRRLMGALERGGVNCTPAAILEFPPDGFTRAQRQHGFIALHCVLAIYCFMLLGVVCEHYFVPAIGVICDKLQMAEDIAGATFMAAASSSPELFINCVGTFVTEGDLGVGAIVGSAVFNVLAVPACCGILAGKVIELDWWSVTRDCMMYAVAVVALILTLMDDQVSWQEALLLVLMYTFYILAMVFNKKLGRFAKSGCCWFNRPKPYTEVAPLISKEKAVGIDTSRLVNGTSYNTMNGRTTDNVNGVKGRPDSSNGLAGRAPVTMDHHHDEAIEMTGGGMFNDGELSSYTTWSWPVEYTRLQQVYWLVTWPISVALWCTIPDCSRRRRLYPLTFIMCIAWIGGVSYLVAWLITVLGDTLEIPDSITGLTILAAGTSLPEAISSVVVTNQGHGSMGLSNSIGSNTFDILLCLGLPWLVKALCYPSSPGNHVVTINSSGISYNVISLLSTLLALYGCLALNKFQLEWRIGITCALIYVAFLVLASLLELNTFFIVNLPICPH